MILPRILKQVRGSSRYKNIPEKYCHALYYKQILNEDLTEDFQMRYYVRSSKGCKSASCQI